MIATDELNEYLEEYLEEKQEVKNLTQETIKKQTFNISKFINFLEDKGVEELTDSNVKKQLRQYRRHCLKKRENKRTTVKTYMMNILEFINSEEVQEEIQHETIKMKDIIEVKAEDPETAKKRIEKISLTRPQSNYLLQTIEMEGNKRDYAICATFLDSGIRLKELVLLNKDDIQVPINDKGFYELPSDTNEFIEVYLRAETTKGELKDRTTFITYDTLRSLNEMITERITKLRKNTNNVYRPVIQRKKAAEEATREELFLNQKGKRIGKRAVQDIIKKYARLTDQRISDENIECPVDYSKNVSVHILRHTALSHYAEILTVAEVQTIAGHSNSQTTDKYIHVDREQMKQKLKVNNMLFRH
ncbi:tyrosine-type recombinase/integrase [Methanobrevibacter millerae]|uniref:Tyrosine recombinase XerC n=1 Tax=Methanobrevibacter millerae TaxID=230361 RepID=A0A0U3EK26_9EURY|nr:tyrosine-type recombinase/integrase [Methanobrevibacter millerae]ALT68925.1 tyrosine recombinase XerC [Methanobrevibacter millerae]